MNDMQENALIATDTDSTEVKDSGVDPQDAMKNINVSDETTDRSGTEMTVETTKTAPSKIARPRNYSHLERNPDTMDEVEACDGKTYKIPATMGSNYWGVLVAMYEKVNTPVYPAELVKRVDEVTRDHNEDKWNEFCGKSSTTVYKRGKGQREVQPIKTVENRIINNAKTLTRWKDYGRRLYERGHILRYEYDGKAQPFFILRTNLDCLKPQSKPEVAADAVAEAPKKSKKKAAPTPDVQS